MSLRLVIISDTHAKHHKIPHIPDGDVLIHAGDITRYGELDTITDFNDFLGTLPHPHKLIIAGNHDFSFENNPQETEALLTNCTYLRDKATTINGVNFYGSPWQPNFHNWAFNLARGPEIRAKWELIPTNTDVLITHGPPHQYGDRTFLGKNVGCADLLDIVQQIKPTLHIFGHIHEAAGTTSDGHTTFINASAFNLLGKHIPPIVYDYE